MTKLVAGLTVALSAVLLLSAVWWAYSRQAEDPYQACRAAAIGGSIGGAFTLTDRNGKTVTDKDVITGPSLIYFGYSFCPDVCPLDNMRNAEAVDILEERGFDVTPIFITIDPARDTPEVMGEYAELIHPRMIGLTGSEEQIKDAAKAYKVYYHKKDSQDEFYTVDHSTHTYLLRGDGQFVDFFRREETADQMAERVSCFLSTE
jgi:protein SCO1/2